MAAPNEAPSDDTQCKDTFLIKSVVVGPGDRVEQSQKLFKGRKYVDGDCKLRVVYVLPSKTREEASSMNRSTVKERSLRDDTKQQDSNGWHAGDYLMKGITVGVLGFIFWYLVLKMIPLLWSLAFIITMFVIKMAKSLVSDSIEDWVVKTMTYLCLHSLAALFRRRKRRNANDSGVSNVG